jgi:transcriptional regulator with XRE-family HTH domain
MDFAEQVCEWRIELRVSQRELARRAELDFTYLSKIEANLVPPPGDEKVLALAIALGRSDSDTQLLRDLADAGRVPGDVVKDAVVRNPEVGALLRRLRTHRLTPEEADQLREIGRRSQPLDPEEPRPGE